ncbi:Retrovirus-related Pol polyprotein from type-2 retrotransposable element R2DM; Endonuclease [Eumeta japonica]|uniref:Retrovirus-related Pol polyprotein from type-2 retrotransposable element R2DM Endonuclease n=1 Tax=Eumeta variegata TaxID=151549 RepID=A0A4C1VH56_EUMVA|nr:Retrovirus-related Pol polyprotein from type-2 retrotransposable element R2DM; Endonuclease [Eumeta japonica]
MEDNEDIPEILIPEVEKAIRSQKTEKAPGPDKITNELMRGTIKELIRLEENQPVEQAGFRKDYSTIDHIHTIKQLLQKYNEYNKTIYLAFIDYSKAFDSLKHESVWQSLKEQGIRNAYINIIKNIYRESKACIRLESTGDVFPINRGIRQETHSPKLFTAVLEQMFRKLNWEHLGLIINGARLNHLRFADDLVIMEEDPLLLEFMTQSLVERSREVGLEINISKTKMMTNSVPVDITINGQKLEYVEEYVYLGQIISPNDQTSKR